MYKLILGKRAVKDKTLLKNAGLDKKAKMILDILSEDPFMNPPSFEKLVGSLSGFYSRRINYKHRIIYQVFEDEKIVRVLRMWTHYE